MDKTSFNKFSNILYLVIVFGVLLIVVASFIVFNIYKSNLNFSPGDDQFSSEDCYDDDYGLNYGLKGLVSVKGEVVGGDYCFSENDLREFYCANKFKSASREKVCENGCYNGACIESNTCLYNYNNGNTLNKYDNTNWGFVESCESDSYDRNCAFLDVESKTITICAACDSGVCV